MFKKALFAAVALAACFLTVSRVSAEPTAQSAKVEAPINQAITKVHNHSGGGGHWGGGGGGYRGGFGRGGYGGRGYYGGRRGYGYGYRRGGAFFYGAPYYYDGYYGGGSCYWNCRQSHGPRYCRSFAGDYCY